MKRLFVGNLSDTMDEHRLREIFEYYGAVDDINLIRDKETGSLKGYANIDMPNDDEADMAIDELVTMEFDGRRLHVSEKRMPPKRGPRRY